MGLCLVLYRDLLHIMGKLQRPRHYCYSIPGGPYIKIFCILGSMLGPRPNCGNYQILPIFLIA